MVHAATVCWPLEVLHVGGNHALGDEVWVLACLAKSRPVCTLPSLVMSCPSGQERNYRAVSVIGSLEGLAFLGYEHGKRYYSPACGATIPPVVQHARYLVHFEVKRDVFHQRIRRLSNCSSSQCLNTCTVIFPEGSILMTFWSLLPAVANAERGAGSTCPYFISKHSVSSLVDSRRSKRDEIQ